MKPIERFALQSHDGPYQSWLLRSGLLLDGKLTRAQLSGYSLLHQYEVADGFFFVHDWDCPFEEMTHFTLLSHQLRVLSSRFLGGPYVSWLLTGFVAIDESHFEARFGASDTWTVTLRDWSVPYLRPRISLKRQPISASD